ncbi:MucR family transcriptional regulator [Azospirillum sp. SYSU D00513]|uniref:MucR family transcriptional regulator n=1 Tax=Azospirillum sp. SYSU D00513 TaxID=2812561 RepID=UPI001A95F44D|nr:MucR family transcriptional regulator [Azospirillum sp. SYSU D00513]
MAQQVADITTMTSAIAAAYLSGNRVQIAEVPEIIKAIHSALTGLGKPAEAEVVKAEPAVSIRKSVTPDYIVCLEDGKKLKMLKRYLRSTYDMTPDEYRTKWGLPPDYPMVAPNYAARRSEFAKQIGLGRKKEEAAPEAVAAPAKRGRRKAEAA